MCPSTESVTTKTGQQDDTLLLGTKNPTRRWLAALLAALLKRVAGREDSARLFTLDLAAFEKLTREAVKALGLAALRLSPHSWRHGGPSHDAYHGLRTLAEIQQRGRWRSQASVLRYEKHGRLLRQLRLMSASHLVAVEIAAKSLQSDMLAAVCSLRTRAVKRSLLLLP